MQNVISKHSRNYRKKAIDYVNREYISCMHNLNESLDNISLRNSSAAAVSSLRSRIRRSVCSSKPHVLLQQRPYSPHSNRTLMRYIQKKQLNASTMESPIIPEHKGICRKSMMAYKSYNLNRKCEQPTMKTMIITAPSIANIYGRHYKTVQKRKIIRLIEYKL